MSNYILKYRDWPAVRNHKNLCLNSFRGKYFGEVPLTKKYELQWQWICIFYHLSSFSVSIVVYCTNTYSTLFFFLISFNLQNWLHYEESSSQVSWNDNSNHSMLMFIIKHVDIFLVVFYYEFFFHAYTWIFISISKGLEALWTGLEPNITQNAIINATPSVLKKIHF